MTLVATHPKTRSQPVTTKGPMTSRLIASRIITAMIGTAMTPLITALQNNALIGSTGVKFSPTPSDVAMTRIA